MRPDICIHHAPCADGFTAAWAIWRRWPDIEFHPGVYGHEPPVVAGKHVLIVDFSYKRPVLERMSETAASITVLDHHKSAEADLKAFAVASLDRLNGPQTLADMAEFQGSLPIQAVFDMSRSGAMLAWEFAHPGEPPPRLVEFVQDRDLWRFDLAGTRAINADLFSHPYEFATWDQFAADLETGEGLRLHTAAGEAIERKHHKDIAELLRICTRTMVIGGVAVKVANMPYTLSSDAANMLAEGAPFGACYYDAADGARVFSLRAKPGGSDVSLIASRYGGGHATAAGFRAPEGWTGDMIDEALAPKEAP